MTSVTRISFLLVILLAGMQLSAQHTYTDPDSTFLSGMRSGSSSQDWDIWINEVAAINNETITDEFGEYDDWIEIHNYGDAPVDLNMAYVTDNPALPTKHQLSENQPGELIIPPDGFLILWADNQTDQGARHLGFSLSGSGEYVGIYEPEDTLLIDCIAFGQQISDVTYGRTPDGGEWNYFPEPTPGVANETPGLFEILPSPLFSENSIFFTTTLQVAITIDNPEATVRYTLDGSAPTEQSEEYTAPIEISEATMLRARAFKFDALPSRIATNTYLPGDDFHLDVISLVTDSTHLWGDDGIYDNRFSGIEKPVHIEYFNPGGELQFEVDAGIKIHAPDNRPQQSLRLFARSQYGDTRIEHQLFEDKDVHWFKRLVLRNGANDGQQLSRTHFRDHVTHRLFSEMDPDNIYSACKPVNVFINGQYWGIYNLRERQDRHFVESNYGYTDIDFLERTANSPTTRDQQAGDWQDYDAMRDYLKQNDMADTAHYHVIKDWMDVRNFVDYMVTEIWTGNRDWLSNNVKYYRPRDNPDTKWKWILWDTEYGLGCYPANDHGNPNFNALHMAMTWGGWPPHWGIENSTYMMHNLKESPEFVDYFITRHADLLNAWLRPDNVLETVDELVALYAPEMPKQVNRWGLSMGIWNNAINGLTNWIGPRASYCREHIISKFDHVVAEHVITLDVEPAGAGYIEVNTIYTDELPWQGFYFEGVPVVLNAIPYSGFQFQQWIETESDSIRLEVWLESDSAFTALFTPTEEVIEDIVINEINYKSAPFLDTGDWIELTNNGPHTVSLHNWQFRDENDNNIYTFPMGTSIDPNQFLILSNDLPAFVPINPTVEHVFGPFDFGLSNSGEMLRLYNAQLQLVDFVEYGVTEPWPESPNGQGTTLELKQPWLENELPQNWFAGPHLGGSPGLKNNYITHSNTTQQKQLLVFPNPSSGAFNVHTGSEGLPVEIEVLNQLGQIVYSRSHHTKTFIIDLQNQVPGLYLARFRSDQNTRVVRLIVR